jgi:hypothetical protein
MSVTFEFALNDWLHLIRRHATNTVAHAIIAMAMLCTIVETQQKQMSVEEFARLDAVLAVRHGNGRPK